MSAPIEMKTVVRPGGLIVLSSPDFPEGRSANVRVMFNDDTPALDTRPDPDLAQAEQRYFKDLPKLLNTILGQWVAYSKDGCVARGDDAMALYRQCDNLGLTRGKYLVTRVEAELPAMDEV